MDIEIAEARMAEEKKECEKKGMRAFKGYCTILN